MHGGKTPVGFALPQTTHGRYSKVLPKGLVAAYETATSDPNLLSVREEAALFRSRILQLVERLPTGEALARWQNVRETWAELKKARAEKDAATLADTFARMDALLCAQSGDYMAWKDIADAAATYQRLVADERKRLEQMQAMVRAEDAALFASALLSTVTRHITDRTVLQKIQDDMLAIMRQNRPEG